MLSYFIFAIAKILRVVDIRGAIAGGVIGTVILTFARIPGYVPFAVFVVGGALVTRIASAKRTASYTGGSREVTRTARHALANCLPPAVFALWCPAPEGYAALACGFAAALADTVSGELGMPANSRPFHLLTFNRTAAGSDGAVSAEGTLYGLGAASLVALAAHIAGAVAFADVWIVIAAGAAGNLADSLIGGFLDLSAIRRGITFSGRFAGIPYANEITNFTAVSIACVLGFILARVAM